MRTRSTLLGVAAIAATAVLVLTSGRVSHGDPTTATPNPAHDPATPYELPGATTYEHLSTAERHDVDVVLQTINASQPDQSVVAFTAGAAASAATASTQIAARVVGLTDTEQDGVIQ